MENYKTLLDAVVGNLTGNTPPPKEEEGEKLTLAPDTAENYGKYVDIGVDVVGKEGDTTDDWMIFYETKDRIYLIAADYVPYAKLPEEVIEATLLTNESNDSTGKNISCWNNGTPVYKGNYLTSLKDEFMIGEYDIAGHAGSSGNQNSQAAAALLNAEVWNHLLDGSTKSAKLGEAHVIGGATLPMWVASWNNKYKTEFELDCSQDTTGKNGYYLNKKGETDSYYQTLGDTSAYNSQDKVYFPQKSKSEGAFGYWLASPSKNGTNVLLRVRYGGEVSNAGTGHHYAVRPLVSLPTSISLTKVEKEGVDLYTID